MDHMKIVCVCDQCFHVNYHMAVAPQDHDHDGKLSFADYEQAVREETLLLEAFGPCLPDPKVTACVHRTETKTSYRSSSPELPGLASDQMSHIHPQRMASKRERWPRNRAGPCL